MIRRYLNLGLGVYWFAMFFMFVSGKILEPITIGVALLIVGVYFLVEFVRTFVK